MTNIKQWQSDQHDGMPQINGYFLFNFSELKTRKRKSKTTLVSFIYREKRKRKKNKQKKNYFTSMTEIIGFQKWKRKEKKKNIYIIVNPFHSRTHLHIYPPVHPVCGMCRYRMTVQLDPQKPSTPLPTHHITQRYTDLRDRMYKSLCLTSNSAGLTVNS